MFLKLASDKAGEHVHVTVFMGPDADHLANCGKVILRIGEWQLFGACVLLGADHMGQHLNVVSEGYLSGKVHTLVADESETGIEITLSETKPEDAMSVEAAFEMIAAEHAKIEIDIVKKILEPRGGPIPEEMENRVRARMATSLVNGLREAFLPVHQAMATELVKRTQEVVRLEAELAQLKKGE